jgi:hypothetical protein
MVMNERSGGFGDMKSTDQLWKFTINFNFVCQKIVDINSYSIFDTFIHLSRE